MPNTVNTDKKYVYGLFSPKAGAPRSKLAQWENVTGCNINDHNVAVLFGEKGGGPIAVVCLAEGQYLELIKEQ